MPSTTSGNRLKREKPPYIKQDPLDITPRLYNQLDRLLDDMEAADRDERMTMPQRISGMIALGRIMKMLQDLKRSELNVDAGSAVNKYAAAFAPTNDPGSRKPLPRSANIVEFDSEPDPDTDPYQDGDD